MSSFPVFTSSLRAHNPRHAAHRGLCHGVFTDRFIFGYILGQFYLENGSSAPSLNPFESIRYDRIRHVCGSMGSISYATLSRGMPWISHSELEFELGT